MLKPMIDLVARIKLKDDELNAALGKVVSQTTATANTVQDRCNAICCSLSGIGKVFDVAVTGPIVAVAGAVVGAAVKTGQFAQEIEHLHATTQLSTKTLQEMKYVAGVTGMEFESLTNTATMLERKLMGIEADNGMASKVLEQLGVSVSGANGELRSMDSIFPEVITKLQGMKNETERNAYASQLFGRSLGAIAPILGLTAEEMKKMQGQAFIMSDEQLKTAERFQQGMNRIQMAVGGAFRKMGVEMMPVFEKGQ